jgi:hypothetical protein
MSEFVDTVLRYRMAWKQALYNRDRLVADAIAGGRMPDHYWQAEYEAREKLRIAEALLEAMDQ